MWVNPKRRRNEVWDCSVYAIFCTHMLNLHVRTEPEWARLEAAVQPPVGDLFSAPEADAAPVIEPPATTAEAPAPSAPPESPFRSSRPVRPMVAGRQW